MITSESTTFTLDNNVLTTAGTERVRLRSLDVEPPRDLQMSVSFVGAGRETAMHTSFLADIPRLPGTESRAAFVIVLAEQFVAELSGDPQDAGLRWGNLSAQGHRSAFVNEPARKKAVRAGAFVRGFDADLGRMHLARKLIQEQVGAPPGSTIRMELRDSQRVLGTATLELRR